MAINPLYFPIISAANSGPGAFASNFGAMNKGIQTGIENRYLPQELAGLAQQQQQKGLQAQQATLANPAMLQSNINSNNSGIISAYVHMLQNPGQFGLGPKDLAQIRGQLAALTASNAPPTPGNVPTKPIGPLDTTNGNIFTSLLSDARNIGGNILNSLAPNKNAQQTQSSQPSSAVPGLPQQFTGGTPSPLGAQSGQMQASSYGVSASNDPVQRQKDVSFAIKDLSAGKGWNNLSRAQQHAKVREYLRGSGYA